MINNLQQAVDQAIASNNMNGGGGYPLQQARQPWGAAHMGQQGFPNQQQLQQQWGMQGVGMPYQMYVPEEYDGYIYSQANPYALGPNAQTWNDYTTGMQEDYGHYSPPQAQAPAPAAPKPAYDATDWLDKTGPSFSWYDAAAADGARFGTAFTNTNPTNREYVSALGFDPASLTKAQVDNLTARRKAESERQEWLANSFWMGQSG